MCCVLKFIMHKKNESVFFMENSHNGFFFNFFLFFTSTSTNKLNT